MLDTLLHSAGLWGRTWPGAWGLRKMEQRYEAVFRVIRDGSWVGEVARVE
jgi:hypothetical protein